MFHLYNLRESIHRVSSASTPHPPPRLPPSTATAYKQNLVSLLMENPFSIIPTGRRTCHNHTRDQKSTQNVTRRRSVRRRATTAITVTQPWVTVTSWSPEPGPAGGADAQCPAWRRRSAPRWSWRSRTAEETNKTILIRWKSVSESFCVTGRENVCAHMCERVCDYMCDRERKRVLTCVW